MEKLPGNGVSDETLAQRFSNGDEGAFTALTDRYIGLIRSITAKYRVSGLECDDLVQEGLLGFLDAVKNYSPEKAASFRTFAGVCIDNRFKTLLKESSRLKRKALNTSVPLDEDAYREVSGGVDPERMFIGKESLISLKTAIKKLLTEREHSVLNLYLAGESYDEIAASLNMTRKSVDNAMQRVRKKLRDHISSISV